MRLKTCFLMLMTFLIVMSIGISSAFALGTNIGNERLGDALLFGYYDTRTTAQGGPNLTDNYFTVTNTSNSYIQGHVRIRTGEKSIELLDFDAMLTPYDVFAFDLYQVNNNIVFASCDTHTLLQSGFTLNYDRNGDGTDDCLIVTSDPASTYYYSNLTSLIKQCSGVSEADAVTQTLKGYAEVLGEGAFVLNPLVDKCKTVPLGKTLYVWKNTDGCDVDTLGDVLMGRVLYADTGMDWPYEMLRLATLNALSISGFSASEVILHKDTYPLELANPTGPGYAYDAAKTTDPDGAHDMNLCFFNAGTVANPVINQVGAAATFGPTLADAQNINVPQRISFTHPTENWKNTVADVDALTYDIVYGLYNNSTKTAYSNFFHVVPPAFAKNLMDTSFVFTFPTMHFIDQKTQVAETAAYDTEENDCIIPPGKFISPGLPGQPTLVPEVAITTPTTCTEFAEGWRSFGLNVNSDAVGSETDFVDITGDAIADDRTVQITGYAPLAICSMYLNGDDVFDTSPMTKVPGTTYVVWTPGVE